MLTDIKIKAAKPGVKPFKLSDQQGLFLLVNPTGSRYWRLKYRFQKREKLLSLGVYPEVSLKEARDKKDEARRLLRNGIDPSAKKQIEKTATGDSFEAVPASGF